MLVKFCLSVQLHPSNFEGCDSIGPGIEIARDPACYQQVVSRESDQVMRVVEKSCEK